MKNAGGTNDDYSSPRTVNQQFDRKIIENELHKLQSQSFILIKKILN